MNSILMRASPSSAVCRPAQGSTARPAVRPFTCSRRAPVASPRNVEAQFFKFNSKAPVEYSDAALSKRDDYSVTDAEDYFNYMGFLAEETTYDRLEAMLAKPLHPIDVILLLACSENDTPKVTEILAAGADPAVKGLDGKSPMELAKKDELKEMLKAAMASRTPAGTR